MDRQGPNYRGGPPGRHGDGTNRLSDTEDSVAMRKKSLRARSQEEDEEDRDWDDYEVRDSDDDDGIYHGRRSTRGGPQGRRGAGSHDMDDFTEDMDLPPRGARRGRGNGLPTMDWLLDAMKSDSRGGHAGGRGSFETRGELLDDAPDTPNLSRLKRERDDLKKAFIACGKNGSLEGDRLEAAKKIEKSLYDTIEEIERLELEPRQSAKMPPGMGSPTHMMDPNPRQSHSGGRGPRETRGEPLDISDLPKLKKDRQAMLQRMRNYTRSGNDAAAFKLDEDLEMIEEDIERLKFEQRHGDKIRRGMGESSRRRDREDYSNEESDGADYEPRGFRRGHHGSAAGYGPFK